MPLESPARVASELASRGYNAEREAVTLLAGAANTETAVDRAIASMSDDAIKLSASDVRTVLDDLDPGPRQSSADGSQNARSNPPSVSTGNPTEPLAQSETTVPVETEGSVTPLSVPTIETDMTGQSTGTGEYEDFIAVFRDRYSQLSNTLRGRVNHRPTETIDELSGGSEAAIIGLVADIRTTAGGHWLVELEDTTGTFPCLIMSDREIAEQVRHLLYDECIAVEGTLADDGGILFVDALHFPDVPRTFEPSTADRHVQAALISDLHVGSDEFLADAWAAFADWLHTDEAEAIEYLLIAGDMVEGVGVYPGQDDELEIIDIYDQYRQFNEYLKDVPGDLEIVMIPGNHDAVRLAEPQPAFDAELRDLMSAHDSQIVSNPALVSIEGVSILMYHGVSLDEVIAELPPEAASYDNPERAMAQLLRKRHVAPQFGGQTRLAPEERDHLVIDEIPDVFHAGHVHTVGFGAYHNVRTINSGCWQAQTTFQERVNLEPDPGYAPILDLDTLDLTVRKFA